MFVLCLRFDVWYLFLITIMRNRLAVKDFMEKKKLLKRNKGKIVPDFCLLLLCLNKTKRDQFQIQRLIFKGQCIYI